MSESTAQRLYGEAFNTDRQPRSDAYKLGVLSALRHRTGETETVDRPDYPVGSAKLDAWCAGVEEGGSRWRAHCGSPQGAKYDRA